MKRTTVLWPELFERTSDNFYSDVEDIVERFPFQSDYAYGATFGLMSVQVNFLLTSFWICLVWLRVLVMS